MPTQWYPNPGPSAAHSHPQHPMNPSHYGRPHHGVAGGPVAPVNGQQNQPYHHNHGSFPVTHSGPSNSAAPASSYPATPGRVPGNVPNNHAPMQRMPVTGSGIVANPHYQHNGGHQNGPFSIPTKGAPATNPQLVRPIPRGPLMQHSYHHNMNHHGNMGHPQRGHVPPGGMRHNNMSNFPPMVRGVGPSNFHYGPNHHHMGNAQIHSHHHGPQRYAPMGTGGPTGPYHGGHHMGDQSMHHNMPQHHHNYGQYHHADHQFQRVARNFESPMNTSIDHSTIQQSPSPPPAPPSTSASPHPNGSDSPALVERVVSEDSGSPSASNTFTLKEQTNNKVNKTEKKTTNKKSKKKNEDFTVDAASILLQLGGIVKKPESNSDDKVADKNAKDTCNKSVVTVSPVNEHPVTIEPSLSCDATADESTPDITSEPSHDSTDSAVTTESDFPAPIPENYPRRLALPQDDSKLNSLHCFLRSDLLEIFVVQKSQNKSPTHSPGSSVGRVGLRCVHCAMARKSRDDRDEAPMAVFYPKSVAEIYRLVTSWQRCHLRKCRNLPPALRSQWQALRDSDKSRGKTHYWVTSAKQIGLVDCHSRAGGIRFDPATVDAFNKKQCQAVSSDDVTSLQE